MDIGLWIKLTIFGSALLAGGITYIVLRLTRNRLLAGLGGSLIPLPVAIFVFRLLEDPQTFGPGDLASFGRAIHLPIVELLFGVPTLLASLLAALIVVAFVSEPRERNGDSL